MRSSSPGARSSSASSRGATLVSVPGSPSTSREYTVPSSFCAMRPRFAESAKMARKEYRASGCLYSGLAGAMERRFVRTSRSVASFLHSSLDHVLRALGCFMTHHVKICCSSAVGRAPSSNCGNRWKVPTLTNVRMRNGAVWMNRCQCLPRFVSYEIAIPSPYRRWDVLLGLYPLLLEARVCGMAPVSANLGGNWDNWQTLSTSSFHDHVMCF